MLIKLILELVVGGLCGCAANKLMKGDSSSILKNVVLGLIGGVVGGLHAGQIVNVYSEVSLIKATDDYEGGICGHVGETRFRAGAGFAVHGIEDLGDLCSRHGPFRIKRIGGGSHHVTALDHIVHCPAIPCVLGNIHIIIYTGRKYGTTETEDHRDDQSQ